MGNLASTMTSDELESLKHSTGLSQVDIEQLFINFSKLDRDQKGYVSAQDILEQSGVLPENKPFLTKLLRIFRDPLDEKKINFRELLLAIRDFERDDKDRKLRVLFGVLDRGNKGALSAGDLEEAYKNTKLGQLNPAELVEISEQTMIFADEDKDGMLNFDEFRKFYNSVLKFTF